MSTDTLSEVLRAVRLTGAVFFDVDASPPWVAEAPDACVVAAAVMPAVEHVIAYHAVTAGACWAGLIGEPPVRLEAGDLVVFPQGDTHVVSSAPGLRCEPNLELYRRPIGDQLPITVRMGPESADATHLVCGFLGCDARPFNPLLATLPRVLHMRGQATGIRAHLVGIWRSPSRTPVGQAVSARFRA